MSAFRKLLSQPSLQPLFSAISSASTDSPFSRNRGKKSKGKGKEKVEVQHKEDKADDEKQKKLPSKLVSVGEAHQVIIADTNLKSESCEASVVPNSKLCVQHSGSRRWLQNIDSGEQLIVDELDSESIGISPQPSVIEHQLSRRNTPSEDEEKDHYNRYSPGRPECFRRFSRIPSEAAKRAEPLPLVKGYIPANSLEDVLDSDEEDVFGTDESISNSV